MNNRGLTLIESLTSVVLLAIVVVSILGGFYISKLGSKRAEHRATAMSIVRELMEKEIASGWSDGEYANADNARTVTDADGISVTYTASHYPEPATISYEGTRPYKLIGWQVSWQETAYDQTGSINCNERAVTYVAYR